MYNVLNLNFKEPLFTITESYKGNYNPLGFFFWKQYPEEATFNLGS